MKNVNEQIDCPRCGSTQITADKRGCNTKKAVAGAVPTGGEGLLAGLHGKDNTVLYCMACGEPWKPTAHRDKKNKYRAHQKINDKTERIRYIGYFLDRYKINKEDALKFAIENNLTNDESVCIDLLYQKLKVEKDKADKRNAITLAALIIILMTIVYTCAKVLG